MFKKHQLVYTVSFLDQKMSTQFFRLDSFFDKKINNNFDF